MVCRKRILKLDKKKKLTKMLPFLPLGQLKFATPPVHVSMTRRAPAVLSPIDWLTEMPIPSKLELGINPIKN